MYGDISLQKEKGMMGYKLRLLDIPSKLTTYPRLKNNIHFGQPSDTKTRGDNSMPRHHIYSLGEKEEVQ